MSGLRLVKQVVLYVFSKGEETQEGMGVRRGVGESCPHGAGSPLC